MAPLHLLTSLLLTSSLALAAPAISARKESASSDVPLPANLARDLATLQAFAQTITEDPTGLVANWTAEGTNICAFQGIYCAFNPDGSPQAVVSIDFNGYELGGALSLDELLTQLEDLTLFHANSNKFVGSVPDLSHLPQLFELDVSNNNLSGEFPVGVLKVDLAFLDLRFNNFVGEIPAELFAIEQTEAIFLNNNAFEGVIPDAFQPQLNVSYLSFANNNFTGPIPSSLATQTSLLQVLFLGNPGLTGTIPDEICALPQLQILDVTDTGLSGQLGPNCQLFAQMAKLDEVKSDDDLTKRFFNFNGTGLTL